LDDEVDVVVSGHSHQGYQGTIAGKLVTQAYAYGTAFAEISLTVDRRSGVVIDKRASIVDTYADTLPEGAGDPRVAAIVADAAERVAPLTQPVVTTFAQPVSREPNVAGES